MGAFYDPKFGGSWDLGTTQEDKELNFTSIEGVFSANAKVDFYDGETLVKTSTLANDLAINGSNTQGVSKTLTLTLQGADFVDHRGSYLEARCTLFIDGDIEVIARIEIK